MSASPRRQRVTAVVTAVGVGVIAGVPLGLLTSPAIGIVAGAILALIVLLAMLRGTGKAGWSDEDGASRTGSTFEMDDKPPAPAVGDPTTARLPITPGI